MDEIKWSKNETISTNLTNIIYNTTDSITNGEQEYLQEDLPINDCYNKDNRSVCLNEPNQFLNDHCKITNDNHGKLNIDGLDRQAQIQQIVENTISEESRLRIHQILELVSALTSPEKLLLYLRLPTDSQPISDPLRQPLNPLGSRSEISQTINWIRTHLEEDSQVAMQKQDVYEEYTAYCLENEMKALSTADFGKVMKQVYPKVRPRRLGTRGNSKYCYAGLRKRVKLEAPILPDLLDFPKSTEYPCSQADLMEAASRLVREWAENLLGVQFPTLDSLACHLIEIGSVDTRSVAALTIINAFGRNSDKALKLKTSPLSPTAGKHRETQLQLQRKLHQREVIREHKRKMQLQSSKCDTNNITSTKRAKKIKIEETTPNTSPIINDENDLLIDSSHQHATTNGNYDTTHNNTASTVTNSNNNTTIVASTPASTNSSPQTIAQGNINNNNNITNISGTLRLLPVCDTKKIMATSSSTTTTLQLITLPDFSSFQNNNVNTNTNNNNYTTHNEENTTHNEVIHDYSNKSCDTKLTVIPKQNTSNKTVNFNNKKPQETITVKAFANKPISRSNSYEHQQTEAQKLEQKQQPTPATLPPPQDNNKQKQQRLRVPRLPNTKIKPVIQSKTTKYKNDVGLTPRSHDNIVKQTVTQNPPPPILGYYNQIPPPDEKLKLEQIEMKNKLKLIPRERVCSIGNIDKDALDDYLYSGNNSQEPEEEIMQYFQNDSSSVEDFTANKVENNLLNTSIEEHTDEKTDKISQLRILLEKNLKSSKSSSEEAKSDEMQTTPSSQNNLIYQNSIDPQKSLILSSLLTSTNPGLNTKRRVSFDTYTTATSSVPPSPNTRRQHFNFTPISPGPNSPGGKQSKNSSTNASPFVSPRNTPVPIKYTRNRSTCTKKLSKDDVKLSIDIGKTSGQFVIPNNLPMSAPPSPMLPYRHKQPQHQQQHYLQTLLDADVTSSSSSYFPNDSINEYIERKLQDKTKLSKLKIENPSIETTSSSDNSPKLSNLTPNSGDSTLLVVHSADPLSQEVSQFFPDDQTQPVFNNNDMFRSQSVPLHHQQIKTSDSMIFYNQQTSGVNNYNFMPSNVTSTCSSVGQTPVPNEFNDFIGDTTSILNKESLDKIFNILQNDTSSNNMFNDLDPSSSQVSNDLVQPSSFMSTPTSQTPVGNNNNGLLRSQSIDLSGVVMINQNVRYPNNFAPSRSVPSTPLPYAKEQQTTSTLLDYGSLSKSHPSTPLINDTGFNYKHTQIGDYLLNGQPIGNNKLNDLTSYLSTSSEIRGAETFLSKNKETPILSDDTTYVDDSFTFSDSVLLVDANDTFNFTTRVDDDTSAVVDDDLMQLSGGGGSDGTQTVTPSDTSDNFVTSTNTEQHFLKIDNKCAVIDNKFVAGSTKLK